MCLAILHSLFSQASEPEQTLNTPKDFTITWLYSDTGPFHIKESNKNGVTGICDGIITEIIKAIPHINHIKRLLPIARIQQLMDEGEPVCYPCMIHRKQATSRARYANPNALYPPFKVIVHKENAEAFIKDFGNPINFDALVNDEKWLMVRQIGRK
ncbi:MAG: hypothetical protein HWE10_10050 [Gammaproteobacteria bacterium]|nr:hypothetical protein [Gammaproteobacteria bacterium]